MLKITSSYIADNTLRRIYNALNYNNITFLFTRLLVSGLILLPLSCGGGGGGGSDSLSTIPSSSTNPSNNTDTTGNTVSPPGSISPPASIVTGPNPTTLAWDSPNVTSIVIRGYNVYYGTSTDNFSKVMNVGNINSAVVDSLQPGTWYFAVTAYDEAGNESSFSNAVGKKITN